MHFLWLKKNYSLPGFLHHFYCFINGRPYACHNKLPMNQKACIVCQDFPAFHTIQIVDEGKERTEYLCSEHYKEVEDPKRFFSLLDSDAIQLPTEETLYLEFFSD